MIRAFPRPRPSPLPLSRPPHPPPRERGPGWGVLLFSLFSRLGGVRWEKRVGVMRGLRWGLYIITRKTRGDSMQRSESDLIYDWNRAGGEELKPARGRVELDDETLRDGLQSPSVRSPEIED